jgi:hypothetical protein
MAKKKPYTCPRCGLETRLKGNMSRHLYALQKPCPASDNVIELTDEIKHHILENRVYHIPKKTPQQIVFQQINNIQQINNYINRLDPMDKLSMFLDYKKTPLLDFTEQVEEDYYDDVKELEKEIEDKKVSCSLSKRLDKNAFISIIDKLTSVCTDEQKSYNVMYDKKPNRLRIFDGKWESHPFEQGVRELIKKVQDSYLDYYEDYLLTKLNVCQYAQEKQKIREYLTEYYYFLYVFNVKPYLLTSEDPKIVRFKNDYYYIYGDIGKHASITKERATKKEVYDMIKKNCVSVALELNKSIMDIIKMDSEFKEMVLNNLQGIDDDDDGETEEVQE